MLDTCPPFEQQRAIHKKDWKMCVVNYMIERPDPNILIFLPVAQEFEPPASMSVSQSHDDLGASPANLLSGKNKSISTPTSDYEGNIFELGRVWNAGKASGKERRKRRYLMQLISKSPRKFLTSSVKNSCPHKGPGVLIQN